MRFVHWFSRPAIVISLGLLAACGGGGGGGGGSNNPPPSNNNPPPTPTFNASAGVAQKGPLINGSSVTVQELDSALSPTGRQFSYQVTSDLGTFSPTSTFNSQYLGVSATGYYFDEVLGTVSTGTVTLYGYNDLTVDSTLNVNLLTTLAYQRVKNLMTNSSMTFAAARAQAESEVLKALNVPMGSYGSFGTLDLKGGHDGDRLLATVSSLFVNGNNAGALSTLINNFQSDLGTNGVLSNAVTKAALATSARTLNSALVAANLTNRYASLGIAFNAADLTPWIDSDGDGVIERFAFRVPDATPTTVFTLPASVVNNLVGKSISASAGQLSVNGTPVSGAVTIAANDVVAVSPAVGSFPDGVLKVYLVSQNQRIASVSFVSGLLSIDVTPATTSIAKGLTQAFTATGHFSDNSTANLTATVSWSSSNQSVATISFSGLASSFAIGSTTITATSGSISGSETLTVTAAQLESFVITPSVARSGVGLTTQPTATGTYTDATTANVTSLATWESNDPAIATVNAQTGLVTGVSLGNTTLDVTIGSLTQSVPVAIVTNQFTAGPISPVPMSEHTATLLPDGRVVAIGTFHSSHVMPRVAIYDPATQSWSQGATLLLYGGNVARERIGHIATLLPNGRILMAGGAGSTAPENTADLYDPATNQWLPAPSMTKDRLNATAARLPDDRVLVVGGRNLGGLTGSAEFYNPTTNTWSAAPGLAIPRSEHTMTTLTDGKLLVAGGLFEFPSVSATTAELYDPMTNTWSSAGSIAADRYWHTATLLADGRVLIAGGVSSTTQAEIYDPIANTWTPAGTLSSARYQHTATLLSDGRVLVAGGYVNGTALATSEIYNPTTNIWSPGPALTSARATHTATTLANGVILFIGGARQPYTEGLVSTDLYW